MRVLIPAMMELESSYVPKTTSNFFCETRFASTFMPVRGTRLSILQFDTSPQRPMGRLLGAEKINFLMSRYGRRHHGGRVGGILSIRGPEVSLGSLLGQ